MGLSQSKKLNYLNFDESMIEWPVLDEIHMNIPLSTHIMLSKKITIQKRIVYDLFSMLGDVGGLYDFLYISLFTIFHLFS